MKKAKVTKIDETTYRFTEAAFGADVYMYLLIGQERALLVDTGYGFTDIPAAIREITPLPLIVVNTHGHMDHVHGNHFYPFVYLAAEDEECFARHTNYEYIYGFLAENAKSLHLPKFVLGLPFLRVKEIATAYPSVHRPLPEGRCFDLGNRRVAALPTPGHTIGSICLLDEQNRWLFSGDTTCRDGVLLNFPESTDVATFRDSIQRLKTLADEGKITKLFPGHQETPLGLDILDTYLEICHILLDGRADEKTLNNGRLVYKRTAIAFHKNKIGGKTQ